MRRRAACFAVVAAAATTAAAWAAAPVPWTADTTRSAVTLSVGQMLGRATHGTLPVASATIVAGDDAMPVRVDVRFHAAQMTTGDASRDAQLRGDRFFDAARYPEIVYTGARVTASGAGRFVVDGTLAMRGVTQPVPFDVRVAWVRRDADGRERVRYEGTARFKRSSFGMTYARPFVSDDVRLDLALEALRT